jgi:hypothetical protein
MTAAYFEDHPTDPDKVIVRKPRHDFSWKSLTDEEIQQALGINAESSNWNLVKVLEWAKKIEAALLEKNA